MSLRRVVKDISGQDVSKCQACLDCEIDTWDDIDVPFGSLVQLVLQDDEEVLYCRTVWSDALLEVARGVCKRGLDLSVVMLALRHEARRRQESRGGGTGTVL